MFEVSQSISVEVPNFVIPNFGPNSVKKLIQIHSFSKQNHYINADKG